MFLEFNLLLSFCFILTRNEFLRSVSLSVYIRVPEALSFQDAARLIQKETPNEYLDAVKKSGKLLYRGETSASSCFRLEPEPDLLLPGTYPESDAVMYFQGLEDCLTASNASVRSSKTNSRFIVRPSVGHIATSSLSDAALWGSPVSVWPLGTALSYAFPKSRSQFFDSSVYLSSCAYPKLHTSFCIDDIYVDTDLTHALVSKREVMFATLDKMGRESSAFVAVPARYDHKLRRSLGLL